ncbi:hypothetical protein POUND7_015434 [Theobroma cacao]
MRNMEIDYTQIMSKEKLEFLDILKEALTIPHKHINFIIFSLLTSFPYFGLSVFFEIVLQQTLLKTFKFFTPVPSDSFYYDWESSVALHDDWHRSGGNLSGEWIKLCLLYLAPYHLLGLLNIVMTVNAASMIYAGEKPISLRDMLVQKTRVECWMEHGSCDLSIGGDVWDRSI